MDGSIEEDLAYAIGACLDATRGAIPNGIGKVVADWRAGVDANLRPLVRRLFPVMVLDAAKEIGLDGSTVPPSVLKGYVDAHVDGLMDYSQLLESVAYKYPGTDQLYAALDPARVEPVAGPMAVHLHNAALHAAIHSGSVPGALIAVGREYKRDSAGRFGPASPTLDVSDKAAAIPAWKSAQAGVTVIKNDYGQVTLSPVDRDGQGVVSAATADGTLMGYIVPGAKNSSVTMIDPTGTPYLGEMHPSVAFGDLLNNAERGSLPGVAKPKAPSPSAVGDRPDVPATYRDGSTRSVTPHMATRTGYSDEVFQERVFDTGDGSVTLRFQPPEGSSGMKGEDFSHLGLSGPNDPRIRDVAEAVVALKLGSGQPPVNFMRAEDSSSSAGLNMNGAHEGPRMFAANWKTDDHFREQVAAGRFMPVAPDVTAAQYIVTHEMGHFAHANGKFMGPSEALAGIGIEAREGFPPSEEARAKMLAGGLSIYGSTNAREAAAESYAALHLGVNLTERPAVKAIADRMGWTV